MSRYHRENPDQPIQHDSFEGVQHVGVDSDHTHRQTFPPLKGGFDTKLADSNTPLNPEQLTAADIYDDLDAHTDE